MNTMNFFLKKLMIQKTKFQMAFTYDEFKDIISELKLQPILKKNS